MERLRELCGEAADKWLVHPMRRTFPDECREAEGMVAKLRAAARAEDAGRYTTQENWRGGQNR